LAEPGDIVNDPGVGTFGARPLPTREADTDRPSPDTPTDELAPPGTVGLNTIVTAHVPPGGSTPPQPLAMIEKGATGGVTALMLMSTPEVLVTTAFCGADWRRGHGAEVERRRCRAIGLAHHVGP
jgi:hypothetical protein